MTSITTSMTSDLFLDFYYTESLDDETEGCDPLWFANLIYSQNPNSDLGKSAKVYIDEINEC